MTFNFSLKMCAGLVYTILSQGSHSTDRGDAEQGQLTSEVHGNKPSQCQSTET